MVAASLCGATTATEFALFAQSRKAVLSQLIPCARVPSHDTFSRLLRLLDPQAFGRAFASFAAGFARALAKLGHPVVGLDGKSLRRAYLKGQAASPPLTVSAFAAQARLCLAAVSPGKGENEVEAAIQVVQLLDLTDAIVTADALHCHKRMAKAVLAQGGNYLLALKGNRRAWFNQAKTLFAASNPPAAEHITIAHHRTEWRRAEVVAAPQPLMPGHVAFVRLSSCRNGAKTTTRLFMASCLVTPDQALGLVQSHWQIENNLHWMLDVHLGEDMSRARKDNAPANTAILKRIARNILQAADKQAVPISHRIKKCAWNDDYLVQALTHMQ